MPTINQYIVSNKKRISGNDSQWLSDQFDFQYGRYFKIRRVTFPNSIYPVGPNNNTFTLTSNAPNGPYVSNFQIAHGTYTPTQLKDELNAMMAATTAFTIPPDGPTKWGDFLTWSYNTRSQKLSLTSIIAPSTILSFSGAASSEELLGFEFSDTYTVSTATTPTITAPYVLDLSYPSQLYLCSKALSSYEGLVKVAGELVQNVLAVLPVDQAFGIIVENVINTLHNMHPKQNKKIDFELRDKYGNLVSLNGGDITIEFLISDSLEALWE